LGPAAIGSEQLLLSLLNPLYLSSYGYSLINGQNKSILAADQLTIAFAAADVIIIGNYSGSRVRATASFLNPEP
jgi:hypothetical protein